MSPEKEADCKDAWCRGREDAIAGRPAKRPAPLGTAEANWYSAGYGSGKQERSK